MKSKSTGRDSTLEVEVELDTSRLWRSKSTGRQSTLEVEVEGEKSNPEGRSRLDEIRLWRSKSNCKGTSGKAEKSLEVDVLIT